jgi:acetyl-CoA carboxylase carboxyl transferase subunit alpha
VPIICTVIGEGGSGGALAVGVGNRILMLEHAIYSVISPEGCAAILWRDRAEAPKAAEALRITAADCSGMGVTDEVVAEPRGGAHRDHPGTFVSLRAVLKRHLDELRAMDPEALRADRYARFRKLGRVLETSTGP